MAELVWIYAGLALIAVAVGGPAACAQMRKTECVERVAAEAHYTPEQIKEICL